MRKGITMMADQMTEARETHAYTSLQGYHVFFLMLLDVLVSLK